MFFLNNDVTYLQKAVLEAAGPLTPSRHPMKCCRVKAPLPSRSIANSTASRSILIGTPCCEYIVSKSAAILLTSSAAQLKLLRIVVSSVLVWTFGTESTVLKQLMTSRSYRMSRMLVVPMIKSLRSGLGGFFLMRTRSVCRTAFEKRGPM